MDNKNKSLAYKIGYYSAAFIAACIAVCVGGGILALTIKFLMAMFSWIL